MTTRHEERSARADGPSPLQVAAASAHLRGASSAVERLLADAGPGDPSYAVLSTAAQAIRTAHQELIDGVRGTWQ